MVLLAVDHIRDFLDRRAMLFSPTNLARTSAPLFLTRWVFGRVPLFYYVGHLFLAHCLSILLNLARYGWKPFVFLAPPSMGSPRAMFPANYGYPLWVTYLAWVSIVAMLYPVCLWYANLKRRRHEWWLSYL